MIGSKFSENICISISIQYSYFIEIKIPFIILLKISISNNWKSLHYKLQKKQTWGLAVGRIETDFDFTQFKAQLIQ